MACNTFHSNRLVGRGSKVCSFTRRADPGTSVTGVRQAELPGAKGIRLWVARRPAAVETGGNGVTERARGGKAKRDPTLAESRSLKFFEPRSCQLSSGYIASIEAGAQSGD